ncbi:MAG: hypothetical protein BMS9Abin07_1545 [Acidimicrobiia bacterium]|nr:MAG: hypothetical protein BMS9Abin07_1545 [Acidimicrobiia bacterium]
MTVENLRDAVLLVPGVAGAEVAIRDGDTPVVRVWTDGSRGDAEIRNDVTDVIAIHGYGSGTAATRQAAVEARVADVISAAPHVDETDDGGGEPFDHAVSSGLVKLIIEETGHDVVAVASDGRGRTARALVGDGSEAFLVAVTEAVAGLRGFAPSPVLIRVEDRFIEGVDVVSVLIETDEGERYAGAAVVRGGRPFSVGRAVDAALATAV